MHDAQEPAGSEQPDGRWKWVLVGFLAVAAFFLWAEHRAHLLGALPYLLILACPLVHIFHHGGHGHGHHRSVGKACPDDKPHVSAPGEQS